MSLYGKIGRKYVDISNNITSVYERVYGHECDLYFPINAPNPGTDGNYDNVNIFATHGVVEYNSTPDVTNEKFYIVNLFKNESMNSPEDVFDNFYSDEVEYAQPFIETSYDRELPTMTKVKVMLEETVIYFMVERKGAVDQANGKPLIRQYLIPMTGELPNE